MQERPLPYSTYLFEYFRRISPALRSTKTDTYRGGSELDTTLSIIDHSRDTSNPSYIDTLQLRQNATPCVIRLYNPIFIVLL